MTKETHAALKKAYAEAVEKGAITFMFYGQEMLTSYAKYFLEYLELPENLKKIK